MNKKLLLYYLLCCFSGNLYGQNRHTTDSLLQALQIAKADTVKIDLHYDLCAEYRFSKPDSALLHANAGLLLVQKRKDKKMITNYMMAIGSVYIMKGNYPKALPFYLNALKIAEELKEKKLLSKALASVGILYHFQKENSKALEYFTKSLVIDEKAGNKTGISKTLNNIGLIYSEQKNYPLAMEYYLKSLKIKEELQDKAGVASALINIGLINHHQKNYDKALDCFSKAIKTARELGDEDVVALGFINIGDIYKDEHKWNKAIDYYYQALKVAKETKNLNNLLLCYDGLSHTYASSQDYKNAYKYHLLFKQCNDSIFNEENSRELGDLKTKYEVDKKQQEMEISAREIAIKNRAEFQKQRLQRNYLITGFLIVLFLAGFIYRNYRQKQLINAELEKKNILVEEKNHEILDSITYAKRLQQAILPPDKLIKEHLPQSFVLYKPKDIVAGDFYWMQVLNDTLFIAAADCTGHGVPGAMVSVICSNALNRAVKEFNITKPGLILDKTAELVVETFERSEEDVKDGMDISLCCLNTKTLTLHWAGAHNTLRYVQNGEHKEIGANKQPIGKHENMQPFTTHEVQLNIGDAFYLFTDGFVDQFGGPEGRKLMTKRFKEILINIQHLNMRQQEVALNNVFEEWKGSYEQVDDVLVIGVKI